MPILGVNVYTQGHPFSARLQAWGRANSGKWYGLIIWEQRVMPDWEPKNIVTWFSAWTRAERLSPYPMGSRGGWVPRLKLPDRTDHWPTPWVSEGTHHIPGVWLTGHDIPDVGGLRIVRLPKMPAS